MKYYGKKSLASFLKIPVNLLLISGIIAYAIIAIVNYPQLLKETFAKADTLLKVKGAITYILFIIGGIAAISIVFNLRKIVNSLVEINPFIKQNVVSLKRIAVGCFIICGCYIINIFINNQYKNFSVIHIDLKGIHTDAEFLIFFFLGCFIMILANVFSHAVEVKEENDFTI